MNPPIRPITADDKIMTSIIEEGVRDTSEKGAIFCRVRRIIACGQSISSRIWGNQKWAGAIPSLILRAKMISLDESINVIDGSSF